MGAAQFLSDLGDLAGGYTVYNHLHQGQDQCLLTPLIPGKQLRGELAVPNPGHAEHGISHPCRQGTRIGSVAIPLAIISTFIMVSSTC